MGEREYRTRCEYLDECEEYDWVMYGDDSDNVYDGWLEGEESVDEVEYEGVSSREEVNVVHGDEV